jgi:hypothetical protein
LSVTPFLSFLCSVLYFSQISHCNISFLFSNTVKFVNK